MTTLALTELNNYVRINQHSGRDKIYKFSRIEIKNLNTKSRD